MMYDAIVTKTFLGVKDDILGFKLNFTLPGNRVVAIGTNLASEDCGKLVSTICAVFNVGFWEQLINQRCKIRFDGNDVIAVGGINSETTSNDKWFDYRAFIKS